MTGANEQFCSATARPFPSVRSTPAWQPPPAAADDATRSVNRRIPHALSTSLTRSMSHLRTRSFPTYNLAPGPVPGSAQGRPRHESPTPGRPEDLSRREDDLPPRQDDLGPADDLPTLVRVVVAGRVQLGRADRAPRVRIEDHCVGIRADR